jgi:hypothetical protein
MSRPRVRDADGWWVPSPGTRALIYGLLKHGLSTSEIADELSLDYNSVRCWRIASAARVFGIEQLQS